MVCYVFLCKKNVAVSWLISKVRTVFTGSSDGHGTLSEPGDVRQFDPHHRTGPPIALDKTYALMCLNSFISTTSLISKSIG